MNKAYIRNKILKIRKQKKIRNYKINYRLILKILKKENIKGKILGGYYPFNHEIDGIQILRKLERRNFNTCLPKIKKNKQMDFFDWPTNDPLEINKFGIPEPTSNKLKYPDILLVPLVAYDRFLNRIGYGGGFYDRYIKRIRKNKNIITIGLAYSFQKVKKIPSNRYDIKLDFIVTEREYLK